MKNPLLSRKFWGALLALILPLVAKYAGVQLDTETLLTIILPVVAYILTEGAVDHARAKKVIVSPSISTALPDSVPAAQLVKSA